MGWTQISAAFHFSLTSICQFCHGSPVVRSHIIAARVEDGDLAPCLGLLGPLVGVHLQSGQVVRQVEVGQVDNGLAARPLAPRLLMVLVHLLVLS